MKLNEVLNKKDDEIKLLKASNKNSASETERVNAEIRNVKKILKSKDKEIYNLENLNGNQQESIKALKIDSNRNKTEKIKLEKKLKSLEKKKGDIKSQKVAIENNNNTSALSCFPTSFSKASTPTSISVSSSPSLINSDTSAQMTPSMVSNWILATYSPLQRPASITSMLTHCVWLPPPRSFIFSTKEVLEGVEKIMKKYLKHENDAPENTRLITNSFM